MLYWPLRAKDLPSGKLKMSKPQDPMAMTKIAFRPQRTTTSKYFQNQIDTSLKSLPWGNQSLQILLILVPFHPGSST
jgi:hypothetical protein